MKQIRDGCHNAKMMYPIDSAIRKYGKENFTMEIIERVENYDEREQYWITYYKSLVPDGYNIAGVVMAVLEAVII